MHSPTSISRVRLHRDRWAVAVIGVLIVACSASCKKQPARKINTASESTSDNSSNLDSSILSGTVLHNDAPVASARVRVKGTKQLTISNAHGRFEFAAMATDQTSADGEKIITAAKSGFFIGSSRPNAQGTTIKLTRLPIKDNEDYAWVAPHPDVNSAGNCANCHAEIFDEWKSGGHANSVTNRRFLNLYDGTNWHGEENQGWNLLASHPEGAGVCSSCHAPSAPLEQLTIGDIRDVRGTAKSGVHCDFCHKVRDVTTKHVGLTHGRFGMQLLRPEHDQIFFGPLDDVDKGEDVHSEVQTKSEFCASCHEGIVFGVHVYSTYSEWLASPARSAGKQCQTCHMKPTGKLTNIAPGSGGIERDPMTLGSHSLFPGGKAKMLRDCLQTNVQVTREENSVQVDVSIRSTNVGHQVPTGFIDRHLILVVEATHNTSPVNLLSGARLDQLAGSFADRPGYLFAKKLIGPQGNSPSPFWIPSDDIVDSRIKPELAFTTRFEFQPTATDVRVRLIYRRFWEEVTQAKQWPDDSIVVYDTNFTPR